LSAARKNFPISLPYAWARYFDPQTSVPNHQATETPEGGAEGDGQTTKKLRASGGVMASKLISQARPSYPRTAKSYMQQGTVVMKATIGRDGKVHDLYLVKPAGFGLDEEALEAVSKWVYQPTTLMGEPVDVETTINVNFNLAR
jgi:TonB family protein